MRKRKHLYLLTSARYNPYYQRIKGTGQGRFRIAFPQFVKLILLRCEFCGKKPELRHSRGSGKSYVAPFKRNNLVRLAPGLDWTETNVVVLCDACKGEFKKEERGVRKEWLRAWIAPELERRISRAVFKRS